MNTLLYIYTNQEIGHITIQLESYHSSKEKLQITNLLGECIYVEQLLINSGFNIFTLNKENFKEGIYIVQFGNYHTKIMVK